MLEQMREGTKHPLLLLMFAILVIVFVFEFGGVSGSEACGPRSRAVAASVNGQEFSNLDLSVILNRVSRRTNNDEAAYAKLQRQAAEKLALLHLLADEAEKMGMAVSEQELRDFILDSKRNVDFQIYSTDGKFDPDTYQRFVKFYLEMTIEDYQTFKTRELLARKYLSVFEGSLSVLPSQVDELNTLRNTKVNLEFIRLDPKQLREAVTFSQDEITAFAEANPDAITAYYDKNKGDYSTPKEVRVRRIMIKKAPESASDADKKKAEEKWAAVKERILTKNEDFATVVKELSEDIVYKDKGGDMGWSKLEDMNEKTAKLVDGMKKGDVKEDISGFAYFLLKLDDVKDANTKPIAEVRDDIASKLIFEKKGQEQIDAVTKQLIDAAKASPDKDLKTVLEELKPKKAEAPAKEDGENKDGEETKEGDDKEEEDAAAKKDAPPEKTVWDALQVAETGDFARTPRQTFRYDPVVKNIVPKSLPWTDVPRIGDSKELASKAFDLTKEAPILDAPIEVGEASFIVRLKEKKIPTEDDLKKSRPQVLAEQRANMMKTWLGSWQTIFYRPDADLAEASPWLASLYKEALDDGRITIYQETFKTEAATTPGATTPAADGKPAEGKPAEGKPAEGGTKTP